MNRRSSRLSGLAPLVLLLASQVQARDAGRAPEAAISPEAAWLGARLPGDRPERFAPAVLSARPFLGRLAFSPDGRECFFTVDDATYSRQGLLVTRYVDGAWAPPAPASFAAGFERSGEPFFSPDGGTLYFTAQAGPATGRMDIWSVDRSSRGWGTPVRLPSPVNSDADEFCFSLLPDGTMYFLSARSGTPQLHRARRKPDRSTTVELVPPPVLSLGTSEGDPCVPPDGRFLVFYSGRAGGLGGTDLMVSFPDGNGAWTPPVNLGPDFNTAADEYGATLSPDGTYLFFVRHTAQKGDLLWVSTRAIEKRRPAPGSSATAPPPAKIYSLRGKPSEAVQDHEAMLALALQVETDLKTELGSPDLADPAVRQRIYTGLYAIAMLRKDHAEARRTLELVRALQQDPARLLTGVVTIPYMDAVERPGADLHATFRGLLSARLAVLPFDAVKGPLRAMKDNLKASSRATLIGAVEAGLDPVVKDGVLPQGLASGLLGTAMNLEVLLPLKEDVVASLEALLAAHESPRPATGTTEDVSYGVAKAIPDGPSLGQGPAGPEPEVFAPGLVSLPDRREMKIAFSPDGLECLIGIGDGTTFRLLYTSRIGGHWSPPAPADFAPPRAQEPFFSPDGRKVFFTSNADIYVSTRVASSWSAAEKLGPPVNTAAEEYHPTVTSDGTLYFCSMRDDPGGDVFRSRLVAGGYPTVEKLDATINSHSAGQDGAYDPFVAPDESYVLFTSVRPDGYGQGDIYVSYRREDGSWTAPRNLGPTINTAATEYGPCVGPGNELFFARPAGWGPAGPSDLYRVRADRVDELRRATAARPGKGR